jgi:hypothetical protein
VIVAVKGALPSLQTRFVTGATVAAAGVFIVT